MRLSDLITQGALSCGCLHRARPEKQTLQVAAGQRFGRLLVIDPKVNIPSQQRSRPRGWRAALCQCDCGTVKAIRLNHLLKGEIESCGCLIEDAITKHGRWQHPLYMTWALMMDRCHNPASKDYPGWGGRGIQVCSAWHDVAAFIDWIEANLGPRPGGKTPGGRPEYTLDRIDNDSNYEPGKVRWATHSEQVRNSRPPRSARLGGTTLSQRVAAARLLHDGGLTQAEIGAQLGVGQSAISRYLRLPSKVA